MLSRIKFEIEPLVAEMLDQLPESVWTSTTTTFFDPAIGGGQFVRAIEQRLRANGHSDANIKGRVYGCEASRLNVNFALNKYKLVGNYAVCDFLEQDFKDMKFDVVVGNPPFNEEKGSAREQSGNSNNSVLYTSFVKLGFNSKYTKLVIPAGWTMKEKDVSLFKENGLKSVKFKPSSTFPNVIIRSGITIVEFEKGFKSDILITTTSGDSYYQSREELISDISLGVKNALSKIWSSKNLSAIVKKGDYLIPKGSKGSIDRLLALSSAFSKNETIKNSIKVLVYSGGDGSDPSFVYTADNKPSTNEFKVTWSVATQLYTLGKVTIVEPGTGVSNANYYIACKTMKEAKRWKTWLDHEFVKISVKFRKTNDKVSTYNNCMNYIPHLPSCDLDIESLLEYFSLDQNDYDKLSPYFG